jgi:RNA polymerase sigma factor (sigma-70 family)
MCAEATSKVPVKGSSIVDRASHLNEEVNNLGGAAGSNEKSECRADKKSRLSARKERSDLVLSYRFKARKLARSILRRWHARLDEGEVDSIVDLSLCEAVQRFSPEKGASFMTFMFFHLRGNLIRAVAGSVTAYSALGAEVDDYLCDGATPGRVVNAGEVARALFNNDNNSPDEELFRSQLASISAGAFGRLDPLEREVIRRIYLAEEQLLDIAENLGYSRCHISRVKKRALETLYHDLKSSLGEELTRIVPSAGDESDEEEPYERKEIRRRRPRSTKPARRLIADAVAA